jgi:hypothetical protein
MVGFPVKDEEVDVVEVEGLLHGEVREDGTILAANIPEILKIRKESKTYRAIRDQLKERGWVWKQRREGGKVVDVVFAPLSVSCSVP